MKLAETFAANVKRHREKLGISRGALAARLGIHRADVGRVERGNRDAKLSTVVKYAEALQVAPSLLLAD